MATWMAVGARLQIQTMATPDIELHRPTPSVGSLGGLRGSHPSGELGGSMRSTRRSSSMCFASSSPGRRPHRLPRRAAEPCGSQSTMLSTSWHALMRPRTTQLPSLPPRHRGRAPRCHLRRGRQRCSGGWCPAVVNFHSRHSSPRSPTTSRVLEMQVRSTTALAKVLSTVFSSPASAPTSSSGSSSPA